jgi:hypothetical protein
MFMVSTMTPTLAAILAHFRAHGGLWLIIPKSIEDGQPRPSFAVLGVRIGRGGDVATIEGGDLEATVSENNNLAGAEWCPVNSRGTRI